MQHDPLLSEMEVLCGLDTYRALGASAVGIDLDRYEHGIPARVCYRWNTCGELAARKNARYAEDRRLLAWASRGGVHG